MKWETVKLEECCVSITDGDHQAPPRAETGIPFIIISDINQFNRIDFTYSRFVPIDYFDALDIKRKPQNGDLLYTVKGSFGIPVYVDSNEPFVFQRDIAILKCNEKMNSKFLFYVMKSNAFYQIADALAIGSAQRAITLNTLKNMQVPMPLLSEQAHIVQLLEPYDSLIENNQKQIKLLEEAAQRLYKEWFIDLRFPGYETTPVHDGVPDGWEEKSVTDLLDIKYGKDHKALADGMIPVYGSGGIMRRVEPILYSGESVLIPRKGSLNNILYVSDDFWTIDTMFYSIPRVQNVAKYMYLFLSGLDMYSFNIGAAVPSMTVKILEGIHVLMPPTTILTAFEKAVAPFFDLKLLLSGKIETATQARDRLLPKLMSGEIEV